MFAGKGEMGNHQLGTQSPGPNVSNLPGNMGLGSVAYTFGGKNLERGLIPKTADVNGPAAYAVEKMSSIGKQSVSQRSTAPSSGFSLGPRASDKIYAPVCIDLHRFVVGFANI